MKFMNIGVQAKSSVRNSHKEKILSWYMPNMNVTWRTCTLRNFRFYSEEESSIPFLAHGKLKYSSKKKNSSFFFSSQKKALPQMIEKRVAWKIINISQLKIGLIAQTYP